jgi:iron(III) transport system substrate-binding protein
MKKIIMLALVAMAAGAVFYLATSPEKTPVVVVYVSEDQVFSEPVLRDFEQETGIRVRAVYDTEEAKSTGVMNRLIAERDNPQADVYWANEPVRAEFLKGKGIADVYFSPNARDIPEIFKDPDGFWTGFSARARVLVVNSGAPEKPSGVMDYADSRWKGRAVIANPLFGTTTAEIAALFAVMGEERAMRFMDSMKANEVAISTGNGESADFVASGQYDFSLVDSDDAVSRIRQGRAVEMVYPDQGEDGIGCFIVPNVVLLIKGAPHPRQGKILMDYLLSRETERKLALADCAQIPLHPGVAPPTELEPMNKIKVMQVNYGELAANMERIQPWLKNWLGH